ncbi:aldo/keto reductase [Neobacillus sp. 19]|uniref:aldo/keto reductase n=1 Tax=Neobacillus sp. 19 TaxID=3394458 RepID=UPI003BF626C6
MEKRRLGIANLDISVIGMGCWQYGGGNYWGEQSQKDVNEVVRLALDQGVNYFDTAEMYNDGESESSLGKALKGRRDQAIIGTKVSPSNAYSKDLINSCNDSLRRLQTDYIDLYMLHWPINEVSIRHFTEDHKIINNPPHIEEVLSTLDKLKKDGKIRYIGVSNHGISQLSDMTKLGVDIVSNELPYNLFSRSIEEEILPFCSNNNIGVIGYMPLQQGLLTGKINSINQVNPTRATSRHFHHSRSNNARHSENGAENEVNEALNKIKAISEDLGIEMAVLSLAWAISNKGIATSIVGARNKEQLILNLRGATYKLTPGIIHELNNITLPILKKLGCNPDYYENRKRSRVF